jgi:hypothetical protein
MVPSYLAGKLAVGKLKKGKCGVGFEECCKLLAYESISSRSERKTYSQPSRQGCSPPMIDESGVGYSEKACCECSRSSARSRASKHLRGTRHVSFTTKGIEPLMMRLCRDVLSFNPLQRDSTACSVIGLLDRSSHVKVEFLSEVDADKRQHDL